MNSMAFWPDLVTKNNFICGLFFGESDNQNSNKFLKSFSSKLLTNRLITILRLRNLKSSRRVFTVCKISKPLLKILQFNFCGDEFRTAFFLLRETPP